MKNNYYVPTETDANEFDRIVKDIENDLEELMTKKHDKSTIKDYVITAIKYLKPCLANQEMAFWYLDEPRNMPADARCEYLYRPTYIFDMFIVNALLQYPCLLNEIDNLDSAIKKGLVGATGRAFKGSGYDDLEILLDNLKFFLEHNIIEFINKYPELTKKFALELEAALKFVEDSYYANNHFSRFDTDCKQKQEAVLSLYKKYNNRIFVYGTLLKGNVNHERYLKKSKFIGNANTKGYALYDLGSYPGIVKSEGGTVKGEVYEIDDITRKQIDNLEGEGSLYHAKLVEVTMENNEKITVLTYVYGHDVNEAQYIPTKEQPWRVKQDDMVWYACYGSNMYLERFKYYIKGGKCSINNRYYDGCTNKTLPLKTKPVIIPFEMYFAKSSFSWESCGVSFLDFNKKSITLGKMYLITREQFHEIRQQEGPTWYDKIYKIGVCDGYEVMTFSNSQRFKENAPSQKYLDVLNKGILETYPGLSEYSL